MSKAVVSSVKLRGFTDGMFLLNSLVKRSRPMDDFVDIIKILDFYMTGDWINRDFNPEGFRKFCICFNSYMHEFGYTAGREKVLDFQDRFYDFVESCFPSELDEEVLF